MISPVPAEKRARRLCLAAVFLLLPLTFAVESHGSLASLLLARELVAEDVPSGKAAPYAGGEWRLDTFKVVTGGDPRLVMPQDRALVVARLRVEVLQEVAELWQMCRFSLVDAEGRRWLPLFLTLPGDIERLIEPDGHSAPSCGSVVLSKPSPGSQVTIEEKFLVPRAALATMTPVVSTAGARPHYLRFKPSTSAL
ncbi:hypothetical protein SAMN05444161_0523 [Rhizobiales bacterium GAS191]|nr:hypothetical protein SAMN05519103_08011 [Rhizobiales bacterium GAS113]SEC10856.1 hypothetical protein SAMN05444161_0523 [Rhizobiales bacterium GAS191]